MLSAQARAEADLKRHYSSVFSYCDCFPAWLLLWGGKKTGLKSDKQDREGHILVEWFE